jgi:hypothetical protein
VEKTTDLLSESFQAKGGRGMAKWRELGLAKRPVREVDTLTFKVRTGAGGWCKIIDPDDGNAVARVRFTQVKKRRLSLEKNRDQGLRPKQRATKLLQVEISSGGHAFCPHCHSANHWVQAGVILCNYCKRQFEVLNSGRAIAIINNGYVYCPYCQKLTYMNNAGYKTCLNCGKEYYARFA